MADDEHVDILWEGVDAWNDWRHRNPDIQPDLSFVDFESEDFSGGDFHSVNFFSADMSGEAGFDNCNFRGASFEFTDMLDAYCMESDFREALFVNANLSEVDFAGSDFRDAQLHSCHLLEANFSSADLRGADLNFSNLSHAVFDDADLRGADLSGALMKNTRLRRAELSGARVFGVTPWDVDLEGAIQTDLVITPADRPRVTVDDLELAQFMYLLLENHNLRRVIETMTSRVVLVLGRFGDKRRDLLDLLQTRIREQGLVPLSIDVTRMKSSPLVDTTTLLARLARFVIADLTGAPQLLQVFEAFVPEVAVPVLPIDSSKSARKTGFTDAWKYPWYLRSARYETTAQLAELLTPEWFERVERKRRELREH